MDNEKLVNMNISMNPVRVELELTEKCNLACQFCYNSQDPLISNKPFEIIDRLVENGVLEIILTGGEPMLHPQFEDIVKKCCAVFSKTMIQTNGTLFTQDLINLCEENGVFGVNISLHGPAKIHDQLTSVDGSFNLALSALKNFLQTNIRVASNFVLTNANKNYLGDFIDFLYQEGLRELTLTRFTPTGVGSDNTTLFLSHEDLIEALLVIDQKTKQYQDLNILMGNSLPYCALPGNLKSFCEYCHFGTSRFYIDINGNVLMCGMSRINIGNILQASFRDIKQNSEIYKQHVLGQDVPKACIECENFSKCRGGCRAAALACTNNVNGADPYAQFK